MKKKALYNFLSPLFNGKKKECFSPMCDLEVDK